MYRSLSKRRVRKCGKNCLFCNYLRLGNGITVTCSVRHATYSTLQLAVAVEKITWVKQDMNCNPAGWSTYNRQNCSTDKLQTKKKTPIFILNLEFDYRLFLKFSLISHMRIDELKNGKYVLNS